jgi:hypothetical protein
VRGIEFFMLITKQTFANLSSILVNKYNNYIQPRIYLILCILISLLLSLRPIPWATDDSNYLDYVSFSSELLIKIFNNPLGVFVDEPLWLLINSFLGLIFENEVALRIIIFISSFIALKSLGILTNDSFLMLLLFVFIGEILAKYILHIRQGLAISLFLFGLARKGKRGTVLRLLTPFIHTSFWIVVFYDIYEMILRKKFKVSAKKRLVLFSILNMVVILLLPYIATLMNDRRVELYNFTMAPDASGNGFIFWIVLGIGYFLAVNKNHIGILGCYGIIFYLESYFFLEFSARILENFLAIIIIAIINTKEKYRLPLLIGLFIYGALGWYYKGGFVF